MNNKTEQAALTFSEATVPAELRKKFNDLLALDRILPEDLKDLEPDQLSIFRTALQARLNEVHGGEPDIFVSKIEELMGPENRNELWEKNHHKIGAAMALFVQQHKRLPSKGEIAQVTGLSRKTIYAHLKGYSTHALFKEEEEEFGFMAQKVLATLLHSALEGDTKASKLFLQQVGMLQSAHTSGTVINNQNSYIQINRTVLSQQSIEQLPPKQLKRLEQMIIKNFNNSKKIL